MKDYKSYFLKQFGIKESQFPPSEVDKDAYPGIDPDELIKGAGEESDEHGMSHDQAEKTAAQHLGEPDQGHYYSGLDKAKEQGMLKDIKSMSPTGKSHAVIAMAVRGSSTGGLPSGIDQQMQANTDGGVDVRGMSKGQLGGYEPIPIAKDNSEVVDKTPKNSTINSNSIISNSVGSSVGGNDVHSHQIQTAQGEAPQAVTGASTDSDDSLTLKSAMPSDMDSNSVEPDNMVQPNIDEPEVELDGADDMDDVNGLNETFGRHMKLMNNKLRINEGCGCCPECKCKTTTECKSCGCGKNNTEHELDENVGVNEPFTTKWKMDSEKGGLVKLSEAFEKMRGLANLGERRVMSNGMWGNMNEVNKKSDKKDEKIPTDKLKSIRESLLKDKSVLSEKKQLILQKIDEALNKRGVK